MMTETEAIQAAWADVREVPEGYRATKYIQTVPHSTTGDHCCCLCNKPLRQGARRRMVHLVNGGDDILHPEDEGLYKSDEGDLLWFFIGPGCAKKLGMEWTIVLER